ncbi:hypothetical protein OEB59_RS25360, partial [Escherichia coli]
GFVKVNGRRRTAVSPERHEIPGLRHFGCRVHFLPVCMFWCRFIVFSMSCDFMSFLSLLDNELVYRLLLA